VASAARAAAAAAAGDAAAARSGKMHASASAAAADSAYGAKMPTCAGARAERRECVGGAIARGDSATERGEPRRQRTIVSQLSSDRRNDVAT
jgi:hypothetical protein